MTTKNFNANKMLMSQENKNIEVHMFGIRVK